MIDVALKRELERDFVSRSPRHPLKLAEFTAAELSGPEPVDPAQWRGCIVAVADLDALAVSNGQAWRKIVTEAF